MNNPQSPQQDKCNEADWNKPRWRERFRDKLTTNNILALATCLIALIGIWQACLTRSAIKSAETIAHETRDSTHKADSAQLALTRDAEHRSLRAYLYISAAPPLGQTHDTDDLATIWIHNAGTTPADSVILFSNFCIGNSPIKGKIKRIYRRDLEAGATSLSPGEYVVADIIPKDSIRMSRDAARAILRGKMAMYFYGLITYLDAFRGHDTTSFQCRLLLNGSIAFTKDGNWVN